MSARRTEEVPLSNSSTATAALLVRAKGADRKTTNGHWCSDMVAADPDCPRRLAAGLGQWIKGHYVALSTIAYVEPLQYTVRAQRLGNSWPRILSDLLAHWEERIPSGALLNKVR